MHDDPPDDDPDDERSERDRELYAAVLFILRENLEKLAQETRKLNPAPPDPGAEENPN